MDKIPENDLKLVLGDLNVQVGREKQYVRITGEHDIHQETKNNGEKLIQFAARKNLRIRSTSFPH